MNQNPPPPDEAVSAVSPAPVRILVVDDDASIRELCRRALTDTDVSVETAAGVEEALALLARGAFDILLTDLHMREPRDGVTLTEETHLRWPDTDILIITGNPSLETAISTLKTGAVDYLTKPFSVQQLQTVVKHLLQTRRFRRELEREKLISRKLTEDYAVLQKVERLKDAILSRLSHELLTPVTIAKMTAETIQSEITPAGLPFYGHHLVALDRMQATVENLLFFAQTRNEDFQITKASVDLWPVLEQLIADYRPLWEERSLSATIGLEGERRPLPADAKYMKAAFSQLLLNAIRFNRKGGSFGVLIKYGPEETAFIFTDTGEGIAPQEQTRIFDGFYQVADHLTREVGGLGVGLAITRRIVEAHGGNVSLESAPGVGSAFTIRLPAGTRPEKQPAR